MTRLSFHERTELLRTIQISLLVIECNAPDREAIKVPLVDARAALHELLKDALAQERERIY